MAAQSLPVAAKGANARTQYVAERTIRATLADTRLLRGWSAPPAIEAGNGSAVAGLRALASDLRFRHSGNAKAF
jgi:hypothetical protein